MFFKNSLCQREKRKPCDKPRCCGRPKDVAKRDDIIAAAIQLFMENGYDLTSMEAVARQAGVSKLTIYSHFADKKELFSASVQARCDKIGMPTSFPDEALLSVEEALLKISRGALQRILEPESIRLIRIVQAEALHRPEIARLYYEVGPSRVYTAFAELLGDFNRQGKSAIPDPAHAARQFFSLLKGEMLQNILMLHTPLPSPEAIEAHIRATVDFFLAAYPATKTEKP
jgi:TetR/AcrR family transcriptional repressor of mexJK operon